MAIRDCRDRQTAAFIRGERVPEFQQCERQAIKTLTILQNVSRLIELRSLPSLRFEALGGKDEGRYSVRISGKWRVCFKWEPTETAAEGGDILMVRGEPYDVEISNHYE